MEAFAKVSMSENVVFLAVCGETTDNNNNTIKNQNKTMHFMVLQEQ